jgi:hypothetical protein
MRKFQLIAFLLLCSLATLLAQKNFDYVSGRSNYLYRGISNPVKILVDGKYINPENFDIHINGGTLRKTDSCIWIEPKYYGVTLVVIGKKGDTLSEKFFKGLERPSPMVISYPNINGWGGTKSELLSTVGFVGEPNGLAFGTFEKVLSFKVRIDINNEVRYFSCQGPLITDSVRAFIRKMKPYDKIQFSKFDFGFYRIVYQPITTEICNACRFYYDFRDILYDFPERNYDWENFIQKPFTKPYELPIPDSRYYDTLPRIVESTCNSSTDTCKMNVFYVIENKKTLTFKYSFYNSDSMGLKYFYHDTLLADFNYQGNFLSGPFTIYYPSGEKREEGYFKQIRSTHQDTVMGISPITLEEEQFYGPYYNFPVQDGVWKYYEEGVPLKTIWYKDGEVMDKKKYYTGEDR